MVLNSAFRPLPLRDDGPSNAADAASSMPDSSADSSDSYNGDDARCFLRERNEATARYSEATKEKGLLEIDFQAS